MEETTVSFERKGVVSVWVFCEPVNPADARKDVLKEMCGVDYYDLDFQSAMSEETLTPLHALIEPLSYSESFIEEAIKAAQRLGIANALEVIAQYDFAYDPRKVTKPIAKDPVFIGYFHWHD